MAHLQSTIFFYKIDFRQTETDIGFYFPPQTMFVAISRNTEKCQNVKLFFNEIAAMLETWSERRLQSIILYPTRR